MPASFSGGVQGTSPPTWFASKSRAPKETAETLFETSVSARAAGIARTASVDFVYTTQGETSPCFRCLWRDRIHVRARGRPASQTSTRACGIRGEVCFVGLDACIAFRRSSGHVATQEVSLQVQILDGSSGDALRDIRQKHGA